MPHVHVLFVGLVTCLLISSVASAAEQTVKGKIKTVDVAKNSITLDDLALDVTRKTKIAVGDKKATLTDIKAGQVANVTYDDVLDAAISIVMEKDAAPADDKTLPSAAISLFNGIDLTGWTVLTHKATKDDKKNTWIVDSDRKVLASLGEDANELRTDDEFDNFILNLEWRFTPGRIVSANGSGIIVRSNGLNTIALDPRGIEVDLVPVDVEKKQGDAGMFIAYSMPLKNHAGETNGETPRYNPDPKRYPKRHLPGFQKPTLRPSGQWNTTEISCQEDRIKVKINGELVNEGWGVPKEAGHICLRNQNSSIEFRNITLIKK